MTRKFWVVGTVLSVLAIVAGVLIAALADGTHSTHSKSTKPAALEQSLTVRPGDILPDAARCHMDSFSRNSLDGPLKWSDSVSTPFKSPDKAGMLKEVLNEDCTNPTVLDMNVKALARITIDGWNVGNHNPWMAQFEAQASDPGLRSAFLTKGKAGGIYVTAGFQQVAVMTNTLILRAKNIGVVTERSAANWHLPGAGLVAGELARTVLNSHQENLPVLKLELTEKGVGCMYAFGYNTGDKRFEVLKCIQPAPKPSNTPTGNRPPGHSVTPASPPSTTHRVPVCTSGPAKGQPVSGQPYGVCPSGKHVTDEPTPTGGPVKTCPGGYLGRDGQCHSGSYTPTPSPTPSTPSHSGTGPTLPAPTEPPVTPTPIASSPTASGTVPPHGP